MFKFKMLKKKYLFVRMYNLKLYFEFVILYLNNI